MDEIRVAIIDDHAIVRQGLRAMIDREPDLRVVGEAPSVYSPVESVPSPALLNRSNLTATLLGMPGAPLGLSGPYPSPPPAGPSAVGPFP